MASTGTEKIPSFGHYRASGGEVSNKTFQYFMVGTFGALTALGAKATVQGELNWSQLAFSDGLRAILLCLDDD